MSVNIIGLLCTVERPEYPCCMQLNVNPCNKLHPYSRAGYGARDGPVWEEPGCFPRFSSAIVLMSAIKSSIASSDVCI
jgi:hypothetical protein